MTVRIEPARVEHAVRVQALVEDPEVRAPTSLPDPYPPNGALRFLEGVSVRHAAGEEYAFAIFTEADGLVGIVGLHHLDAERRQAELGYWIGRPYWGRGLARAAVGLVIRTAFGELGLDRLVAHALAGNTASRRVLEANGFRLVGLRPHGVEKWPADQLAAFYELAREEAPEP